MELNIKLITNVPVNIDEVIDKACLDAICRRIFAIKLKEEKVLREIGRRTTGAGPWMLEC